MDFRNISRPSFQGSDFALRSRCLAAQSEAARTRESGAETSTSSADTDSKKIGGSIERSGVLIPTESMMCEIRRGKFLLRDVSRVDFSRFMGRGAPCNYPESLIETCLRFLLLLLSLGRKLLPLLDYGA